MSEDVRLACCIDVRDEILETLRPFAVAAEEWPAEFDPGGHCSRARNLYLKLGGKLEG